MTPLALRLTLYNKNNNKNEQYMKRNPTYDGQWELELTKKREVNLGILRLFLLEGSDPESL